MSRLHGVFKRTTAAVVFLTITPNLLVLLPVPLACAQDLPQTSSPTVQADTGSEESPNGEPIVVELANGITSLTEKLAQQHMLLKMAKTEREQQLISSHIRTLERERRGLQNLLLKLVGPDYDVQEEMSERKHEQGELKDENVLDRQQ